MKTTGTSTNYLQAVVNSLEDELLVIDRDYRIVAANEAVRRLPPQMETALFRVVQESISNITRHAGAKNASLSIHFKKGVIMVIIKDDGRGFDVEEAMRSKQSPRGLGLLGMKERVELFNGTLDIRSRLGEGTEIHIEIPTV